MFSTTIRSGRKVLVGFPTLVSPTGHGRADGSWTGLAVELWKLVGADLGLHYELTPLNDSKPFNVDGSKGKVSLDVTAGSNGDYKTRSGWDACTGLGTPNGQNLAAALKAILSKKNQHV